MPLEVHRVVQHPDDLDGAARSDSIEEDVPRVLPRTLDVVASDVRLDFPVSVDSVTMPQVVTVVSAEFRNRLG